MKNKKYKRITAIAVVAIAAIAAGGAAGLHFATQALKGQVEQALGPASEVSDIVVGWSSIELRGIRIDAPKGWPASQTLRAERVVVYPDILGLFSARVHVPRITIENAYVSAHRTRDGKFRLLPSLLEPAPGKSEAAAPAPEVTIGAIELTGGVLEFFDTTVRRPAHKTRLEQLQVRVDDLRLPALSGRSRIWIGGTVKGVQRNGKLSIDGWAEVASKNSDMVTKLQGVDLVALQPYLIKASETGVRRGTLDLKLRSTVRNNRLHAPGTMTLSGLELTAANGPFGTFMGVPRQAVVAALKNRNDQISIDFTLDGNLNDPRFSLNDNLAKRIGTAVASGLGISIEGLTSGVGGMAEGIGGAVRSLFGN